MAKGSGSTRVSKWTRTINGQVSDLYFHNGSRVEYHELSESDKNAVKQEKKRIAKQLATKLASTTTPQVIDNGEQIDIHYTAKGLDHFCNDAMLTLSGKYFSEDSMMRVNEILERSTYIPTEHGLSHERNDDRELWFRYQDADGRGVYLKVTKQKSSGHYTLYSVVDKI